LRGAVATKQSQSEIATPACRNVLGKTFNQYWHFGVQARPLGSQ